MKNQVSNALIYLGQMFFGLGNRMKKSVLPKVEFIDWGDGTQSRVVNGLIVDRSQI